MEEEVEEAEAEVVDSAEERTEETEIEDTAVIVAETVTIVDIVGIAVGVTETMIAIFAEVEIVMRREEEDAEMMTIDREEVVASEVLVMRIEEAIVAVRCFPLV